MRFASLLLGLAFAVSALLPSHGSTQNDDSITASGKRPIAIDIGKLGHDAAAEPSARGDRFDDAHDALIARGRLGLVPRSGVTATTAHRPPRAPARSPLTDAPKTSPPPCS